MISVRLGVTGVTVAAILATTSLVVAQQYYIDPAGNDANSGTSPDQAWATLANLESMGFFARVDVYFRAGGKWETTGLRVNNATYAAYGDGPAP